MTFMWHDTWRPRPSLKMKYPPVIQQYIILVKRNEHYLRYVYAMNTTGILDQ